MRGGDERISPRPCSTFWAEPGRKRSDFSYTYAGKGQARGDDQKDTAASTSTATTPSTRGRDTGAREIRRFQGQGNPKAPRHAPSGRLTRLCPCITAVTEPEPEPKPNHGPSCAGGRRHRHHGRPRQRKKWLTTKCPGNLPAGPALRTSHVM